MPKGDRWNPKQRAHMAFRCAKLRDELSSNNAVAHHLGLHENTVAKLLEEVKYKYKDRFGPGRTPDPERVRRVLSLWESGNVTEAEIALTVGCSRRTVIRYLKKHGRYKAEYTRRMDDGEYLFPPSETKDIRYRAFKLKHREVFRCDTT